MSVAQQITKFNTILGALGMISAIIGVVQLKSIVGKLGQVYYLDRQIKNLLIIINKCALMSMAQQIAKF